VQLKVERIMVGRPRVVVTACDAAKLEALARSARRDEADRTRAIVLSGNGWTSGEVTCAFGVAPDSVRRWRTWFMAEGVDGLRATPQAGAAPVKSEAALTLAREVLSGPVADRPNRTLVAGDIVLLFGGEYRSVDASVSGARLGQTGC